MNSEIIYKFRNQSCDFAINIVESQYSFQCGSDSLVKIWEDIKAQSRTRGVEIWDGLYYRLENLDELQTGSRVLKLGTIRYSTVRSLIEYRKKNTILKADFPNHLNTGALVRTSDGFYLFGKKKAKDSFCVDLIGGGLQESELKVRSGEDLARNMLKELKEEVNLDSGLIKNNEIVGFVLADTMSVVILFEMELKVSLDEVFRQFNSREDFEFVDLVAISREKLPEFLAEQKNYIGILGELL